MENMIKQYVFTISYISVEQGISQGNLVYVLLHGLSHA